MPVPQDYVMPGPDEPWAMPPAATSRLPAVQPRVPVDPDTALTNALQARGCINLERWISHARFLWDFDAKAAKKRLLARNTGT